MEAGYKHACSTPSDINEHIPTLYKYGLECSHITECGVRSLVSSYAFGFSLVNRGDVKLVQVDPDMSPSYDNFKKICEDNKITNVFYKESDLTCPMEHTDLLFIDTWHVYGQLKRELNRWNSYVKKYIILHDTTVDEKYGETLRCGMNAIQQSKDFNMPVEEIVKGLWPAVEEFLKEHPEWTLFERYTNNNGLTILKRA